MATTSQSGPPEDNMSTKSRLLKLPTELRLMIYDFYFSHINLIQHDPSASATSLVWLTPGQGLVEPPLLCVSVQMRSESLELYHKWLRRKASELEKSLNEMGRGSLPRGFVFCERRQLLGRKIRVINNQIQEMQRELTELRDF